MTIPRTDLWGPPRPFRTGYTLADVGWAFGAFIVIQVLVAVLGIGYIVTSGIDPTTITTSTPIIVGGLISLWVLFAGFPLLMSKIHGTGSLREFGVRMPRWRHIWQGLIIGLVLRLASIGLTSVAEAFGVTIGGNTELLTGERALAALIFIVVATSVIGPVMEEIFFRGFLMKVFSRYGAAFSIIASSVLFGLMHINSLDASGLFVVTMTGLCGLALALIAHRDGDLRRAMTVHIAFNTSGVALSFLVPGV